MNDILFFILGVALGFYIGETKNSPKCDLGVGFLDKKTVTKNSKGKKKKGKKREQPQTKIKAERKKKIMVALKSSKKITNNDIQKLLKVSDATATNYTQELEDEGKIKQVGKTGQSVYYKLVG